MARGIGIEQHIGVIKPDELQPGDHIGVKVVAVIGFNKDWAAYMGPSFWTDDVVSRRGDKISEEAAERMFDAPVEAGLSYRR